MNSNDGAPQTQDLTLADRASAPVPVKVRRRRSWARVAAYAVGLVVLSLASLVALFVALAWTAFGAAPSGARLARVTASPEHPGSRFTNALPTHQAGAWTMLRRFVKGAPHTVPTTPPPSVAPTLDAPPATGLRITWLGHSALLIEIDGKRVLTDPVFGERASPLSFIGPRRFHPLPIAVRDLPELDAVVLSHDHYDHLDRETIELLADRVPRFLAPLGVGAHLEYWGVPPEKITELDWWESARVSGLELVATPARHFSGRSLWDKDRTLWAGWGIVGPTHRVYFSGDTAMFPEVSEIGRRLGPFDATLIEVGAYSGDWPDVHLGPEQAVRAHRAVSGDVFFPIHWGTFNLALHPWTEPVERLRIAAQAEGIRFVVPMPGQSIEPSRPPPQSEWWPKLPFETAAEAPVVSTGLVTQESSRGSP